MGNLSESACSSKSTLSSTNRFVKKQSYILELDDSVSRRREMELGIEGYQ